MNTKNNEINLFDFICKLWGYKFWIFLYLLIVAILSACILYSLDNIYLSNAVLKPLSDSTSLSTDLSRLQSIAGSTGLNVGTSSDTTPYYELSEIVNNKDFRVYFIKKYHFEHFIIKDYDEVSKKIKFQENSNFFISKALEDQIKIEEDQKSNFIKLSYMNRNRRFTQKFLSLFLMEVSNKDKAINMLNIQQQIDGYHAEIAHTNDITTKAALSVIVTNLIRKKIAANAQKYYNFSLIISPSVPDKMDKYKPHRFLMFCGIIVANFFICVIFIIFKDAIKIYKKQRIKIRE